MMKKLFAILLTLSMLFTTAVLLAACAANDGVPKEAKQLFQKYMDGCANDLHEAAKVVLFTDDAERVSFEDDAPFPELIKCSNGRKSTILFGQLSGKTRMKSIPASSIPAGVSSFSLTGNTMLPEVLLPFPKRCGMPLTQSRICPPGTKCFRH